jgi:rRNA-processing protein FCF1
MIQVVLDTSIYRMDPKRNKAAFRAFTRLCTASKVQLHIPYFVKHEFLSQQRSALENALTAIQTTQRQLLDSPITTA